MTQHAPTDPSAVISPKVIASTLAALLAPVIVALLDAVTLDLLTPLGTWAPVVLAGISALSAAVSGYFVRDPLRRRG